MVNSSMYNTSHIISFLDWKIVSSRLAKTCVLFGKVTHRFDFMIAYKERQNK